MVYLDWKKFKTFWEKKNLFLRKRAKKSARKCLNPCIGRETKTAEEI